jgi:hypothetical protein
LGRSGDQARNLLAAQHDRERSRLMHRLHLDQQLATAQGDVEEELQSAERRVDGRRGGAGVDHVQLEGPKVLGSGRVRRPLEERGEPAHGTDVVDLRLAVELAHAHVVDHALAQGRDIGRQ